MTQSQLKDEVDIYKVWTPAVRDAFIEMARESGCFDRLVINGQSCYGVTMIFNPSTYLWEIKCERLSPTEAPDCYHDGATK